MPSGPIVGDEVVRPAERDDRGDAAAGAADADAGAEDRANRAGRADRAGSDRRADAAGTDRGAVANDTAADRDAAAGRDRTTAVPG